MKPDEPYERPFQMTPEQMARARHPKLDTAGFCKRCCLRKDHNNGHCPPGFWMNKRERQAWDRGVRYVGC